MSRTSLEELIFLIFSAGRLIREQVGATITVPYLHLATLRYVAENKQPLMREIAQYLHIAAPSATSLINALVKSGQIKRIADHSDRRIVRLEITAKGQKALDDGMRQKQESLQKLIKGLGDHEREQLKNILEKLMRLSTERQ